MTQHLLEQAIRWQAAGIVALPVRSDGTKAPGLASWKEYQQRQPTIDEYVQWFGHGAQGIGVLTGAVSGHLEMVELEGRAILDGALARLKDHADNHEALGLLDRVIGGYCEQTPSVGIHLLYRVEGGGVRKNTKLARTADRQVLAETRGEGGFVVVAPSAGTTHPTGAAWSLVSGSIEQVATITVDERDLLWAIIRMLDEEPEREPVTAHAIGGMLAGSIAGTRPGDDYNERADWSDILTGWTRATRMGSGYGWRKPGKEGPGISATTGQSADGVDRIYVFSTSTEFEPERPYNKFSAYALLEHGGDYASAAKALAAAGYGSQPQQSTTRTAEAPVMTTPDSTALSPALTLAKSEDGHSQALIAEWGAFLRYCPQMGRWLHWDGHRWHREPAGGGIAREYSKAIARQYPDDWATHKKRSLSASGTSACLSLTETDHRIAVDIDALDAHPWELNTPGGIINLRTGQLRPPDPAALHTRSTRVAPDPDADPSPWLEFLATTFQGDQAIIGYIRRLMGYACVGEVREAILPVFHGQGANGKTVLLETVQAVLGDYATVAPQKFLVQGPGQHATEIAAIAGARLVIASETNEGERFDEAKVKILTGGDRIKARFMRQDEFTFKPSHLLVMMTNHRPEVGSGGTSFWRRLREIPFGHVVPEDARDPELTQRLTDRHGPAIMAWLAQGAAEYARDGLREPDGVKVATRAYEASTDTVGRFVDDMVILGGGDAVKVNSSEVRDAYETWCRTEGETPVAAKALTTQLMGKYGIGRHKGAQGVRFLTGMTLVGRATEEEPATRDSARGGT
jgi:putative DNA primase/helicase